MHYRFVSKSDSSIWTTITGPPSYTGESEIIYSVMMLDWPPLPLVSLTTHGSVPHTATIQLPWIAERTENQR